MVSITIIGISLENKPTSIQIYETTRKELLKVIGQLQSQDGNKRNYDEAITELIRFWNEKHR